MTGNITEVGSTPVVCITKSVNYWMYSCKVSLAVWDQDLIQVAVCTFVVTGLHTRQSFTASHIDEEGISSIHLYTIPLLFVHANCISGHLVSFVIFLTWVIKSKEDLIFTFTYLLVS